MTAATATSWLERDAVIGEEISVLRCVGIFPAVVSQAVADIQKAATGKSERDTRRKVSEEILAAEPIGHNAGFGVNRLLVSDDHTRTRTGKADRSVNNPANCL